MILTPAAGPSPRALLALLLAYPVLTHLAVHFHSLALTAVAAMVLLLAVLRGPMQAGRGWAWVTAAAVTTLLVWSALRTGRHDALFALYAAPVLIYLFLAWIFGRTLGNGGQPLISQMAAHLRGQTTLTEPELQRYTRQLTAVWTTLFLLLAGTNAVLALLASPDGVLELLGMASPWPLSPTLWSLFANFLSFGLVMLLFAAEFAYRRRRYPEHHARYRGLLDFLNQLRTAMPALMRASTAGGGAPSGEAARMPRIVLLPSRRRAVMLILVAAHLLGIAAIVSGEWLGGAAVVLASHVLAVWGTLAPGSAFFGPLVRRFATDQHEVWLTIDDGPSADTQSMLDLLDAHGARATFFLVGERAAAQPDTVAAISRRGHTIGNHSDTHPSAWFWAALPAAMAQQIGAAQHALTPAGCRPPQLFRAVVGMANFFVAPTLERHGLIRVGWTARGYDSITADPAKVWARLRRGVCPGAILLLHEGAAHGASVATLAHALEQLDRLGYRCVLPEVGDTGRSATTSQLLNGVPPHNGENCTSSPASRNNDSSVSRAG